MLLRIQDNHVKLTDFLARANFSDNFFFLPLSLLCRVEGFLESPSNHNLMNHFLQIRQFSIYPNHTTLRRPPFLPPAAASPWPKKSRLFCSKALAQKSWLSWSGWTVLSDSELFLRGTINGWRLFVRKQKASFLQFLHFFRRCYKRRFYSLHTFLGRPYNEQQFCP